MKTINPFLPTSSNPSLVPSQLTKAGGALYLVNQSNVNYLIDFQNGNKATLLAQYARLYRLPFPLNAFIASVQSTVIAPPLKSPQVWGEAFQPGEDTSGLFTGPLTNDIMALGQPNVYSASNVDNQSFNQPTIPGTLFYLIGWEISMDKAATPSSGLFVLSGLDSSIVPTGQIPYWLVQSNQQVWIEKKYGYPIPQAANSQMSFAFPNLSSSIGFNYYGWYQ